MTAFYIGGMYLNDFFDRAIDARERPGRPIDLGEISASTVSLIGFGLLALGIVLMSAFGFQSTLAGCCLPPPSSSTMSGIRETSSVRS